MAQFWPLMQRLQMPLNASRMLDSASSIEASPWRLHRIVALYVLGVLGFLALMLWAEGKGLSRHWIGPIFLFFTVMWCTPP